jgi:hypothetical protein
LIGTGSTVKKVNGTLVLQDSPPVNLIPAGNNNILGVVTAIADDPKLSVLADHGGPTPTHRLEANSPAIDKGSNALATIPLSGPPEELLPTDQRGEKFTRIFDLPGNGSGTGPTGFAVDIGAYEIGLPKVIDVIVSSSLAATNQTLHPAYHFNNVAGSGEQLRTVPVGGADTVTVRFSENVTIPANAFALNGIRFGNNPAAASPTILPDEATWTFNAQFAADHYLIEILDTVTGPGGNALDGEWWNPQALYRVEPNGVNPGTVFTSNDISRFPSGDGSAGGHFKFVMTVLPGDASLDNFVSTNDFGVLSGHFNTSGWTFREGDLTGEGEVNTVDFAGLSGNYNVKLRSLLIAEVNGDGLVDGTDLAVINAHYGMSGATLADGDANLDGLVDGDDILLWQLTLGIRWVLV